MSDGWRTTDALCRECGWSEPRLFYELVNGRPYRSYPPGYFFNFHDPDVRRALNVEASTMPLGYASAASMATVDTSWGINEAIGIEVLADAVADAAAHEAADEMMASASVADAPTDAEPPTSTARWAIATTRRLRAEGKIPERATRVQAELARVLEAEAENDWRAGKLRRVPKATYLEDQLVRWGIWPLNSSK